jgi:hypothetical protein
VTEEVRHSNAHSIEKNERPCHEKLRYDIGGSEDRCNYEDKNNRMTEESYQEMVIDRSCSREEEGEQRHLKDHSEAEDGGDRYREVIAHLYGRRDPDRAELLVEKGEREGKHLLVAKKCACREEDGTQENKRDNVSTLALVQPRGDKAPYLIEKDRGGEYRAGEE